MELTNELFERGKNQKEICSIVDDNYVLLSKSMPCTDADLESYISRLTQLKNSGVNIATIVDYKLIENTTHSFDTKDGKISYTKGVFLEERAKGINLSSKTFTIKTKEDMNDYLEAVESYLNEIEKRARADQSVYDKLLEDYLKINSVNLTPDPKPLNFFFDENIGYTFIDVIDNQMKSNLYLVRYLCMAAFGFGLPTIHSFDENFEYRRILTESMLERYNEYRGAILYKILAAAAKYNIEQEFVKPDLENEEERLAPKAVVIKDEELDYVVTNYNYNNGKARP